MKKILIVEDEFAIALDIQSTLVKMNYDVPSMAGTYDEAVNCVQKFKPDLVLMDIQISGDKNGIEAANHIYQEFNIPVIFLTANNDKSTFKNALKSKPFGYVLKPFRAEDLVCAIEVALEKYDENQKTVSEINQIKKIVSDDSILSKENNLLSNKKDQYYNELQVADNIFIKSNSKFVRLSMSDVLWVEAMDNYCKVITSDDFFIVGLFLKQLYEKLPKEKFIRVHRSYVIAIDKVEKIEENTLYISNNTIPIGRSYKEELITKLNVI